jgi:hypothetical protein
MHQRQSDPTNEGSEVTNEVGFSMRAAGRVFVGGAGPAGGGALHELELRAAGGGAAELAAGRILPLPAGFGVPLGHYPIVTFQYS